MKINFFFVRYFGLHTLNRPQDFKKIFFVFCLSIFFILIHFEEKTVTIKPYRLVVSYFNLWDFIAKMVSLRKIWLYDQAHYHNSGLHARHVDINEFISHLIKLWLCANQIKPRRNQCRSLICEYRQILFCLNYLFIKFDRFYCVY